MKKKLIITYSLTGSSKTLLQKYPEEEVTQIHTKVQIPHSLFRAGFTILTKDLGSYYEQVPDFDKYDDIVIIIPVWMSRPAKVFTDVYKKHPFSNKNLTLYLTSMGYEIKPLKRLVKLVGKDNSIEKMYIYGGKRNDKKLLEIDQDFNKVSYNV